MYKASIGWGDSLGKNLKFRHFNGISWHLATKILKHAYCCTVALGLTPQKKKVVPKKVGLELGKHPSA